MISELVYRSAVVRNKRCLLLSKQSNSIFLYHLIWSIVDWRGLRAAIVIRMFNRTNHRYIRDILEAVLLKMISQWWSRITHFILHHSAIFSSFSSKDYFYISDHKNNFMNEFMWALAFKISTNTRRDTDVTTGKTKLAEHLDTSFRER